MNCDRAEELFSDYRDRALAPPLERALAEHLETCDECRDLYHAFEEVTEALGAFVVPALPHTLTQTLARGMPVASTDSRAPMPPPRLVAGASWLAVAAALFLIFVFRPPEIASDVSRATSRSARLVYSFTVRTYSRTERWLEDLNVLRMTVVVAFEDRLDQINEKLRDLEDAGRRSTDDDEQSREVRELEDRLAMDSRPRDLIGVVSDFSQRSSS